MVYVESIEDDRALIFDGPVISGSLDSPVLTSSSLADVQNYWEYHFLPDKEVEWPALQQNAMDALRRIELYSEKRTERNLLDFGSGWGFFLEVAKGQGWTPFGVEPLPTTAVYARATFGLNIITDTLHANTFPSDFFHVITSFQVFEHLPRPDETLRDLYKMLRPDGILLIEVPNFDTWTMRIMGARHRHFVQDHLNFFSVKTLSQLLTQRGFRVMDHYNPTRRMSVRHLTKYWFQKHLPTFLANALESSLQRTGLWEQTISLNIGDIITVIARKPA